MRDSPLVWRLVVFILSLCVFTVALGYGVLLPLLPEFLKASLGQSDPAAMARHLGTLTATYAGAPILFAPLWGRLCDRIGAKTVLIVGLAGFALTSLSPLFEGHLWSFHAGRFVNGGFAAAVGPAALTIIAARQTGVRRARGFALVAMATLTGYFVGPLLSQARDSFPFVADGPSAFWLPFAVPSIMALTACVVVYRVVSSTPVAAHRGRPAVAGKLTTKLLLMSAVAAGAPASFEVALILHAQQTGLGPNELALMFAECSLFMLVGQAIFFWPLSQVNWSRWLIAPALLTMGLGLVFMPIASGLLGSLVLTGVVALSGGVALPVISYWISMSSSKSAGLQQGIRSAVTSTGQSVGALLAGFLFAPWLLPDAPFIATAIFTIAAGMWALNLPGSLATVMRTGKLSSPAMTLPPESSRA